jgi:hypothetical protein
MGGTLAAREKAWLFAGKMQASMADSGRLADGSETTDVYWCRSRIG